MIRIVGLVDLTLRDAHQSLLATRMRTSDLVQAAELLDEAGFYALEAWERSDFRRFPEVPKGGSVEKASPNKEKS